MIGRRENGQVSHFAVRLHQRTVKTGSALNQQRHRAPVLQDISCLNRANSQVAYRRHARADRFNARWPVQCRQRSWRWARFPCPHPSWMIMMTPRRQAGPACHAYVQALQLTTSLDLDCGNWECSEELLHSANMPHAVPPGANLLVCIRIRLLHGVIYSQ